MSIIIRPAQPDDTSPITEMVNRFAAQQVMLPRTEESVRQTLGDWLVAIEVNEPNTEMYVVGCGSLVPLTEELAEIRSLAIAENQQGKGIGGKLVLALIEMAHERRFPQICALTLRENFFIRLGFELVDRWSVSPKVWQECIYCPKFHRCDEVAVLMNLAEQPQKASTAEQPAAWNTLLRWGEWQPLKLAYQRDPNEFPLTPSNHNHRKMVIDNG